MKKLLLLVGILLLLVGSALGYFYFVEGKTPLALLEGEEKSTAEKDFAPERIETKYVYVNMPPLSISIITDNRVEKIFSANIILETTSDENKKAIESILPRLQNGFLQYLHKYAAVDPGDKDFSTNGHIKLRLKQIANQLLGKELVTTVLLQATFERKL